MKADRTVETGTEVARLLDERLTRGEAETPRRAALVAVDDEGGETIVTWQELRSAVGEKTRILANLREACPDAVVHLVATADPETAVTILACLCVKVPILAISSRATPDQVSAILLELGGFGEPISAHTAMSGAYAGRTTWRAGSGGARPDGRRQPLFFLASSGSTGLPKLIPHWGLLGGHRVPNLLFAMSGARRGQRQLVISSLYHLISFTTLVECVLGGGVAVLQRSFSPRQTLDLIETHAVEWLMTNPMQMREMTDVGGFGRRDFSSLKGVLHSAGPCPADVKREWMATLAPRRVYESYGATEGIGTTLANGAEWLARPGTVGRGFFTDIQVRTADGSLCAPGEVGRIYMASRARGHYYERRPWLERLPGGLESLGDIGWLDEGGYLYVAGREQDQTQVDGATVTPAKADLVLQSHPDVKDSITFVVVDDTEVNLRAAVVPKAGRRVDPKDVISFCSARLEQAERPRSVVVLHRLPRTAVGKIRRRLTSQEYEGILLDDCKSQDRSGLWI